MADWIHPDIRSFRTYWPRTNKDRNLRGQIQNFLLGAVPILALLAGWHLLATYGDIPAYLVPSPLDVLKTLQQELLSGRVTTHLQLSLRHYLMGLGWGITLGISLGAFVGWTDLAGRIIEPIIALLRPIPPLAWIPFAIIALGINTHAAAFIIGIGAFYINFYNTLAGVRGIDKKLLEAARVLGDGLPGIIWRVVLRAAAPAILTGIRISIGQGWMTVIAAEMFGIRGLGQRLMEAAGLLAMDVVITYMIVIGVMHLFMDLGFRLIERSILRWR